MKKTISFILVLVLAIGMALPAFATGKGGSQTTVGVQVYDYDPTDLTGSVSFEVPLYVTLAVTKSGATGSKVIVPDGTRAMAYGIKNTTALGGTDIAVSELTVAQTATAGWTLSSAAPSGKNVLQMKLGTLGTTQITLPDLITTAPVKVGDAGFISSTATAATNGIIKPQDTLLLPIAAAIDTTQTYNKEAAAAQFVLKYTLKPVLGGVYLTKDSVTTYIGNVQADAGYTIP
ncbi:MAG: hypothetical protein RSB78_00395 [Oscillospiraceae bacterium]